MKIIPYYKSPPEPLNEECCIHLKEDPTPLSREPELPVWLESYDPSLILGELRTGGRITLNSLWLEERYWHAYREHFPYFDRIVLVPHDPANRSSPYESKLETILRLAEQYRIRPEQIIVDVCILPYFRCPDLDLYALRARAIREMGLKTVAGIDNLVFRERKPYPLLAELLTGLDDSLTYGLISSKYAHFARETLMISR